MSILSLCREIATWSRGMWAAFVVRGKSTANLKWIMRLQNLQHVFPMAAKRLVFSCLARRSIHICDGSSMNNLAVCYARGIGVAINAHKAYLWYKEASEHGCAQAVHSLAGCYYNGFGTAINDELAFKTFCKSVELRNYKSACFLGLMYFYGEYVEKSLARSFLWYRLGAMQGDANSQYDLSKCYRHGDGCEISQGLADVWLYIAAQNGSVEAREELQGDCAKWLGFDASLGPRNTSSAK